MRTLQADLPPLLSRVDLGAGGMVTTPVPVWQRHVRTLADPLLHRLARAGLRAAAAAGQPVDVEWAVDRQGRIWLLQCRPITSRPLVRDRADVLWTRRFFGERWTDPVTPMGWSIVEPLLTHFIAYPRTQAALLGGGAALRLIDGRPYLNATVFRHLAFKLPGSAAPQFMLELLPPDEELAWRARFAALPDLPVVAALLRETAAEQRWERFAWNPWTNPSRWRAFAERVRADLPAWRAPRGDALELIATVEALTDTLRDYIGVHVLSLLYAGLGWQALRALLDRALPDDAATLHTALAVSPPGNRTLDAHQALWALARQAAPGDLDALADDEPTSPRFARALEAFIDAWGHRADASWELFSPRWSDGPERFLSQLRQAAAWSPSPSERAAAQEARFNAALADVTARTAGPARAAILANVHLLRRYLLLRENQRELFEQLMAALHDRVVDAGRLLVRAGLLGRAEDVAYLTWPEVRAMMEPPSPAERDGVDPAAVRRWVMRRRTRREEARLRAPPVFLRGDGVDVPDHAGRWSGLGVSPGRAQGVVRVLRSPADARRVGPGDVVVARAIDPSWTSLFLSAGAVVCELGGALSHGAVLAREYGLPMVVNLADATTRLRDGQEVTVDGARGMVFVHG
jgi:pyruvate,water dikinase